MRVSGVASVEGKAVAKAAAIEDQQDQNGIAVEAQRNSDVHGRRRRSWLLAGLLCLALIIIGLIIAIMTSITGPSRVQDDLAILAESLVIDDGLKIVPHESWSQETAEDLPQLRHPTPYVVLKHTASRPCAGLEQCGSLLRDIRELHWQRFQQPEISYNFLIDTDGVVYEGRGWDTTNVNKAFVLRCNVDVALIGNYVEQNVTEKALMALQKLLGQGVVTGKLAPDFRLLAHNQVTNTLSPGRWALKAIENWPPRCLHNCDKGVQCIWP